jgi:hypothetical protein
MLPTATRAGWFKEPCPKGPDGHCIPVPCDPFLEEVRALAAYRRQADDPRCPAHGQASHLADLQQESIDRSRAKMSTACIRKAAAIMRSVASVDVRTSYANDAGAAVALVRYTNNAQRAVRDVTISCSALRDASVVGVGTGVIPGPIQDGASSDLQIRIGLAGAPFSCVQCELTIER